MEGQAAKGDEMDAKRPAQGDAPLLPEHRVGAALRSARLAAGVTLREMARRLNYGSHSTLSEYEMGARMPSETVVEGYERCLQLRPGELMTLLEEANIERHGDAWAKRRLHFPIQFHPTEEFRDLTSANTTAGGSPSTTSADSPWPRQPVADGSDPDAAGCSVDAITVHSRRISLTGRKAVIGHIELRYCQRSRAAWGRFEGYAYLDHLANKGHEVHIVIEVTRHGDNTHITTKEPYLFDFVWSDLLVVDSSLFHARATVLIDDEMVASGETDTQKL
jgi:transcriptional regulator with XRE-family HTH domain